MKIKFITKILVELKIILNTRGIKMDIKDLYKINNSCIIIINAASVDEIKFVLTNP